MLVLDRKIGQRIIIGGNITIKILAISYNGRRVKIGIDGPEEVLIVREELLERDNERQREG